MEAKSRQLEQRRMRRERAKGATKVREPVTMPMRRCIISAKVAVTTAPVHPGSIALQGNRKIGSVRLSRPMSEKATSQALSGAPTARALSALVAVLR